MPELPELEYMKKVLSREVIGASIKSAELLQPLVVRFTFRGDFAEFFKGRTIEAAERIGKTLALHLSGRYSLLMDFMLTGRLSLNFPRDKSTKALCFRLIFEDGRQLRYTDQKKMGKVYIAKRGDIRKLPPLASIGVDPLGEEFTTELCRSLLSSSRSQAKSFLLDQSNLCGIGNAYADEILFAAGINPKSFCRSLNDEESARLYSSIVDTLRWALENIERRAPSLGEQPRDFLRVRNRALQPCPRCGSKIRRAGVRGYDAFFCPTCQPAKRELFIDWGKLSSRGPQVADDR